MSRKLAKKKKGYDFKAAEKKLGVVYQEIPVYRLFLKTILNKNKKMKITETTSNPYIISGAVLTPVNITMNPPMASNPTINSKVIFNQVSIKRL